MSFDPTSRTGIAVITGSVLLLAVVLIGTFGAPTDVLFGEDPVVVMEAHSGPNGQEYVVFEEDDQLKIDVSERGLNPGARTTIRQLFNITNEDDKDVSIWLSHDSPDTVRFYNDRTGARLDSEENEVLLQPGDRIVVSMYFDTSGSVPGDDLLTTVTVNARFEPDLPFFDITDFSAPNSVIDGEPITVDADVENTGEASGEQTVKFLVNGTVEDSREVSLDPGQVESLTFEYDTSNVSGDSVSVEVVTNDSAVSRNVDLVDGDLFQVTLGEVPESITTAETLTLDVTVENIGEGPGSQTIEFLVNESVEDSRSLELDVGESRTISLSWSPGRGDVGEDIPIAVRSEDDEAPDSITVLPTVVAEASASSYVVEVNTSVELWGTRSSVPIGSDPTYTWTVDGNSVGTGETIDRRFDEPGTYDVSLTVTAGDLSDTDSITITVEDTTDPTARFDADETVEANAALSFDASASADDVGIASYVWDFGDGTVESGSTLSDPSHTYDEPGRYRATLTVTDTSGNSDSTSKRVEVLGPNATISPGELTFGEIGIGSSAGLSVDVENRGTADLELTDIEIGGSGESAFSLTGNASSGSLTVRPGETRSIGVTFEPDAPGDYSVSLDMDSNDPALGTIPLSGTGLDGTLEPIDSSIEYGGVPVGMSESADVTIENTGEGTVELAGASIVGSDQSMFSVSGGDDFPTTLVPGESHTLSVDFIPSRSGERTASLRITDGEETASVALRGTGRAPSIHLTPDDLEFPTIGVSDWTEETLTIRNYGNHDLDVDSISVTGADAGHFEVQTDSVPDSIHSGDSATFDLRFDPQEAGDHEATLSIESNDPEDPTLDVPVRGPAVAADIGIDRRTVDFGNVTIGETVYMTIEVRNRERSLSDLTIDETRIVADEDDAFAINAGGAPVTLSPGETHEIEIAFQPLTAGVKDAQLQILSDAGNHPLINVWLSNTRTYIIVEEISNPTVRVDGYNLVADDTHDVNVWAPSIGGEPAGFSEIGFTNARDGNFEMNIIHDRNPRDPVFEDSELEALEYIELAHLDSDPDETFDNTSVEYQVDKRNLASDVGPGDVRLYRWNEDRSEWVDMTDRGTLIEETDRYYVYRVDTPGFSQFTVTAPPGDDGGSSGSGGGGSGGGASPGVEPAEPTEPEDAPVEDTDSAVVVEAISSDEESMGLEVSEVSTEEILAMDGEFEGRPPLALIDARPVDVGGSRFDQAEIAGTVVTVDGEEVTIGEDTLVTTTESETYVAGSRSLLRTADSITAMENMVAAVDVSQPGGQPEEPVTLRFSIDRNRFPETMPEDVSVGHRTADGWELLDAEVVGSNGESVLVEVETDSFSIFAVFVEPQVRYDWTLHDGSERSRPAFTHTFEEPGVYPIDLTVTDAFDRQDSTTYRIVANDVPVVRIADVIEDPGSNNVTLVAEVDEEVGEATVTWTFSDGTERVGTEVTHELEPGDHTVELHATDELGGEYEATEVVTVGPGSRGIAAAIEGLDGGLTGIAIAISTVLLVVALLAGYRWFPWGLLKSDEDRPPEIVRVHEPSLDSERNWLVIEALSISAPSGRLESIAFELTDSSGRRIARKALDIDPASGYEPTDEELVIPLPGPIDSGETYTLEITARSENGLSDSRSVIDVPLRTSDSETAP